jgi:hypothetical protein
VEDSLYDAKEATTHIVRPQWQWQWPWQQMASHPASPSIVDAPN